MIRLFNKGAGNSARQFADVGLYLSRLPSTQTSGSLPTKMGVKWVCRAKYKMFSV